MSLVFGALRNISINDDYHILILKFFTEGFENLPSSFFSIQKICYRVLSAVLVTAFILTDWGVSFRHSNKMADSNSTYCTARCSFT